MATAALQRHNRRFDDLFFSAMAVVVLVSVLVGFSQTYFVAPLPNLTVKIHAAGRGRNFPRRLSPSFAGGWRCRSSSGALCSTAAGG